VSTPEPERLVKITRKDAAKGQLESAILLWFLEEDHAAIHTLAVAAQTLLHNIGTKSGKGSGLVRWIKSQPKSFQKRSFDAQNFFKHANTDPNRILTYAPAIAEIDMIDACVCFYGLYGFVTPLMLTFSLRFSLFSPDVLPPDGFPVELPKGFKIEELVKLSRREFLDRILPYLTKRLS
jgi:hypothetical protein